MTDDWGAAWAKLCQAERDAFAQWRDLQFRKGIAPGSIEPFRRGGWETEVEKAYGAWLGARAAREAFLIAFYGSLDRTRAR